MNLEMTLRKVQRSLRENLLFSSVWILALITVLFVNITAKQSYNFVGMTDSKEDVLNTNYPVVIKHVNVISGQSVEKGQLLAELERPELAKQINQVSGELEELVHQYELNESLTKNLKSIKRKRAKGENSLTIKIKSLKRDLALLKNEQDELLVFATFDGHIGSVNFKVGENVSPFSPIMTMHKKTPTFVRGFIHESISHEVTVNSVVRITNLNSNNTLETVISSVGTRIVEFPVRFQKAGAEVVWGREVVIKLPENNDFLLGEKVFMEVVSFATRSTREIANTIIDDIKVGLRSISLPKELLGKVILEPSGVVYSRSHGKYLVISDDNNADRPLVYMMDSDGNISSEVLSVEGLDKIKDMEAMTQDEDGNIYIASSQSKSRSGNIAKSRRLLIKVRKEKNKLVLESKIKLISKLDAIAKKHPNLEWVKLLSKNRKSKGKKFRIEMDLEGMAIKDNVLYLGLRNKVASKSEVAILSITDIQKTFVSGHIEVGQVELWSTIETPINFSDDRSEGISGIQIINNEMIIVTASNKVKNKGRLLKVSMETRKVTDLLAEFDGNRPEGIAFNIDKQVYVITFDDNTGEKSSMVELKL